ncbi:MAG TPA: class I SAM-dependent methyltransferase [Pyrinomonadaceae bacterium]|nr:class I SAM-dependent methyltransferase [Pyrinomonadaceae bacterium]
MSRVIPRVPRLAAALACAAVACAFVYAQVTPIKPPAPQTPDPQVPVKKDVPYVPTPEAVVDEMLKMAAVTKDDVVYDLGCGDGRIVVTAAKRYGARGVGIDIDPQRIAESNANAQQAGVTSRVEFKVQDLFEADLKEATVVTLYLLPSINMKLRPKLFAELKPGTRVVSHAFDMGDWKPDKTTTVDGRPIYFWVIPEKGSQPTSSQ